MKNPFRDLTKFEFLLWITSVVVVCFSFLFPAEKDYLTLIASLIGVTALIFVAKGYVLGQVLSVVFAVFYGIISFYFRYYGEVITYLLYDSSNRNYGGYFLAQASISGHKRSRSK